MGDTKVASVPDSHRHILEGKGFAHVATLGPQGGPRCSPMWYEWDGTRVLISHTKGRQKYRDLKLDARVALSIRDPEDDYRYIEIRGTAQIHDDPKATLIHRLAKKYRGVERYQGELEGRIIVEVTPERVTTYG
jgi:PPOX class probable F420-dependent enzyme